MRSEEDHSFAFATFGLTDCPETYMISHSQLQLPDVCMLSSSQEQGHLASFRYQCLINSTLQAAEFQAQRCMYLARVYLTDAKPREARALFSRAAERAKSAMTKHEDCSKPDALAIKASLLRQSIKLCKS